MKAIYRKELDGRFETALKTLVPSAKRIAVRKKKGELNMLDPGEFVFQIEREAGLVCFITVRPHSNQEEFLLDVGWSSKGYFNPAKPRKLQSDDRSEFEREECFLPMPGIFLDGKQKARHEYYVWKCSVQWDAPGFKETFIRELLKPVSAIDAVKAVDAAVAQAMEDIRAVALPYFDELVAAKQSQMAQPSAS